MYTDEKQGYFVRNHRVRLGLTQRGLANLAEVSKTAVNSYEHGWPVRIDTRLKVLKVLYNAKGNCF